MQAAVSLLYVLLLFCLSYFIFIKSYLFFVLFVFPFIYLFLYWFVNLLLVTFFSDVPEKGAAVSVGGVWTINYYYYYY